MRIYFTLILFTVYSVLFAQSNVDTVYSGQVTSKAGVQGFNLAGATIGYARFTMR
ncbi:MAG: hypothetical protein R2764_24875 [Bacteroidales bacterium]